MALAILSSEVTLKPPLITSLLMFCLLHWCLIVPLKSTILSILRTIKFYVIYHSEYANQEKFSPIQRLDWKKGLHDGSIDHYVSRISDILRPLIGKKYNDPSELEEEIKSVSEQVCCTASCIIPHFKPRKHRKHFMRNPELKELSAKCKVAWRKWCDTERVLSLRRRKPSRIRLEANAEPV